MTKRVPLIFPDCLVTEIDKITTKRSKTRNELLRQDAELIIKINVAVQQGKTRLIVQNSKNESDQRELVIL